MDRRDLDKVDVAPPRNFTEVLADDLNTSGAIAVMHDVYRVAASAGADGDAAKKELRACGDVLGLRLNLAWVEALEEALDAHGSGPLIERLIAARAQARAAKDFVRADAIRDAFASAGVDVKDTKDGVEWSLLPGFDASKLEGV